MNGAATRLTLPNGHWVDGVHHRRAELRPLTGADQESLGEAGAEWLPVECDTAMLACCVTRLDGVERVTSEALEGLTAGDREALLLHLRRLTLGERLQCVLTCPAQGCGKKMDLDIEVSELLLEPYATPRMFYEMTMLDGDRRYTVHFRLPTGADQMLGARLAVHDTRAAADQVLGRCISAVTDREGRPVEEWPPALPDAVAKRMAELDPQAELNLSLACPECGQSFSTLFNTGAYFHQELGAELDRLYREIHLLAFHYHWGEGEIMAMTPRKRQRYLTLLLDSLSGESLR